MMVRIPTHRPPTNPGEKLLEESRNAMALTQRQLEDAIYFFSWIKPEKGQFLDSVNQLGSDQKCS